MTMKSSIFIPKKIKVGFNPRSDTYTGRLGYVIYHDGKVWRKETSWKGWIYEYMDATTFEAKKKQQYEDRVKSYTRQHAEAIEYVTKRPDDNWYKRVAALSLKDYLKETVGSYDKFQAQLGRVSSDPKMVPVEFENVPTEGFVLNKKAGGTSSGWDHRQTYCRVYDPRGFEFEIVIPNLLYILENATSTKGKGLSGKFIYGWDGKDLVLIPEEAPEYKDMVDFTATLELKVAKKDLIPGGMYKTAQGETLTYLTEAPLYNYDGIRSQDKVLWFFSNQKSYRAFDTRPITALKKYIGDDPDFVNLLDKLDKETSFKPKNPKVYVYEQITDVNDSVLANLRNDYYGYAYNVYIPMKGKNKFKNVSLRKQEYPRPATYQIVVNNTVMSAGSIKEFIEKYPIYKQIKEHEKVSQ